MDAVYIHPFIHSSYSITVNLKSAPGDLGDKIGDTRTGFHPNTGLFSHTLFHWGGNPRSTGTACNGVTVGIGTITPNM